MVDKALWLVIKMLCDGSMEYGHGVDLSEIEKANEMVTKGVSYEKNQ